MIADASFVLHGMNSKSDFFIDSLNCSGTENELRDCLTTTEPVISRGSCNYSGLSCTGLTYYIWHAVSLVPRLHSPAFVSH